MFLNPYESFLKLDMPTAEVYRGLSFFCAILPATESGSVEFIVVQGKMCQNGSTPFMGRSGMVIWHHPFGMAASLVDAGP